MNPGNGLRKTVVSDHMDMIRGVAALAVLFSHARVLLVESRGSIPAPPIGQVLYLLSGFGYPAVMAFFVLSGYLVGGSVIRAVAADRWSWRTYLLARGTRLYVVLIPALLLTGLLDQIGLAVVGDRVGNLDTARAIVDVAGIRASTGGDVLLGNLFFLQTIAVPAYGSNIALWSLAHEFWYYLIFPCLWLAWRGRLQARTRALYGVAAVGMLVTVGPVIALYFVPWLLGAALAVMSSPSVDTATKARSTSVFWLTTAPLLLVLALVGLGRFPNRVTGDFAVALTFAPFFWALLQNRRLSSGGMYARVAATLAGCSYTLYAIHLPILMLLRACFTYERPWPADGMHWAMVLLICAGLVGGAFALSQVTEARTDSVRRWLTERWFANR